MLASAAVTYARGHPPSTAAAASDTAAGAPCALTTVPVAGDTRLRMATLATHRRPTSDTSLDIRSWRSMPDATKRDRRSKRPNSASLRHIGDCLPGRVGVATRRAENDDADV